MATEKTPAMCLKKVPLDPEQRVEKLCNRTSLSWILAIVLVTLIIILSIQFIFPVFNQRFKIDEDHVRIFEDQPFEVRVISSGSSVTPEDMEHTGVNPWDFNFLIDPVHLCISRNPPNSPQYQQDPEVKLLMLVPSDADHFDRRNAIRKTWGSIAEKPLGPLRLGFVLGISDNSTVSDLIKEESSKYRDIIQADFVDTYHHKTTKSILMLKWVAKRCPHAQYFLKADDDTFINVAMIADILRSEPFISEKKFIGGYVHTGAPTTRLPQKKNCVLESDYPFDEYPPYASASAYVMTGPTAIELFDASKEVVPFIQQEDVFLTGLCAEHIDAPRIHDPRFRFDDPPSPPSWNTYSTLASAHSISPDSLETIWSDMTETALSIVSHLLNQESAINATALLRIKRNL